MRTNTSNFDITILYDGFVLRFSKSSKKWKESSDGKKRNQLKIVFCL